MTRSDSSGKETLAAWLEAIRCQLDLADMTNGNKQSLKQLYSSIASLPNLITSERELSQDYPQGVLFELVKRIHTNIWPS